MGFSQYLDHAAGEAFVAFDWLVGIGVGTEVDGGRDVTTLAELLAQQRDRIALGEDLRLEIETGRKVQVRMRRPRVAIDAAVLTAAIGVDRLLEADVGRIVVRNDRARLLDVGSPFSGAGRHAPAGRGRVLRGPSRRRTTPQRATRSAPPC